MHGKKFPEVDCPEQSGYAILRKRKRSLARTGGVKTLILMAFDESNKIFNASACGDNCAKWILRIAGQKDLTINLRHIMDFGKEEFQAKILNTGEMVHNMSEFVEIAGRYV
ncbi:MAG TPA: DUF4869 domain-containing protein [Candidatus Eisenbergiella intestinipullorum]|nr:DUF4869 domain-containing protein [Candidatus Eisenbergiella intestinipullorum]